MTSDRRAVLRRAEDAEYRRHSRACAGLHTCTVPDRAVTVPDRAVGNQVVQLTHSSPTAIVIPTVMPYRQWQLETDCNPAESVQDLTFPSGVTYRQVSRQLKDPGRPKDIYVFDRLARFSAWGHWMDTETIVERLLDPASNPFAKKFEVGGELHFTVNDLKNAVKRLRQAGQLAGLDRDQMIIERDGEYHVPISVAVMHIWI